MAVNLYIEINRIPVSLVTAVIELIYLAENRYVKALFKIFLLNTFFAEKLVHFIEFVLSDL